MKFDLLPLETPQYKEMVRVLPFDYIKESLDYVFDDLTHFAFMANDEVVGQVSIQQQPEGYDSDILCWLEILPQYRHRRFGCYLLDALKSYNKPLAGKIRNKGLEPFYEKNGFEIKFLNGETWCFWQPN